MGVPENNYTLADLPLDVVEVVAGYLSIRDLLACCACSRSMRDKFSDNSIWRPRCDRELCEYLRVTPCKVRPHFVAPKFEHTSLSPIPTWKVSFMYQNHLWNNWKQGRKVEEVIESETLPRIPTTDKSTWHLFLTSDCIMTIHPERIELLDVRESPATKAANDIKIPFKEVDLEISQDSVVIYCATLVLVYHIDFSTKESILKYVFFVQDSRKLSDVNGVENLNSLISEFKLNREIQTVTTALVGNILVAILEGESRMHIWNIKSGNKIKIQDCPIEQASVLNITVTGTMNIILCVQGKKQCHANPTFLIYDLTTFTYLPFRESAGVHFVNCCATNKDIAIWGKNFLNIYDYITGTSKQLLKNQPIQAWRCQAIGNNFVFLEDSILKIFLSSSKMVKCLYLKPVPQKSSSDIIYHVVDNVFQFRVLHSKFIQVELRNSSSLPVYEVDDAFTLKQLSPDMGFQIRSINVNKTLTRCIVQGNFATLRMYNSVIHFW